MEIKGEEVMLKEYAELHNLTPEINEYLLSRLVFRARTIYVAYLHRFKTDNNRQLVTTFDRTMRKQYPDIYKR